MVVDSEALGRSWAVELGDAMTVPGGGIAGLGGGGVAVEDGAVSGT